MSLAHLDGQLTTAHDTGWTMDEIIQWTSGEPIGACHESVLGISTDSRTVKPNELFVALKGPRLDGHEFVREARSRGAIAAMVARPWVDRLVRTGPLIAVDDPLKSLHAIAHQHWMRWHPLTIGVTGSAGKTTTKELIASVLAQVYSVQKAPSSYNNQIGLALTLLAGRAPHQIAVLEYGASHPGEIASLCQIAFPKIAVVTNIGPAHLEFFGNLRGVLKAKWDLVKALPRDGIAVINGDDPMLRLACAQAPVKVVTCGVRTPCDIRGSDLQATTRGVEFTCLKRRWHLPLLGLHNVWNALAALAVARTLGVGDEAIQAIFAQFQGTPGRLQMIQGNRIRWIDDSYNANPLSLKEAIQTLRAVRVEGRRIAIIGDMLELGPSSARWHRAIGRMVARARVDRLITVGQHALLTALAAQRAGLGRWAQHCPTIEEAHELMRTWGQPGDVILVKGSHAMQLSRLIPQDDNAV